MLEWFEQLESVIDEVDIIPENMYNVDETGFSIGIIKSAYVVINKAEQFQSVVHLSRQKWATIIECISANGMILSSFIILKGKNVLQS
jgi:predicted patatin/cPLA2 family phospholipase